MKYRKKPVVIDVFTSRSEDVSKLMAFVESFGDKFEDHFQYIDEGCHGASVLVKTLEGSSYNVNPKTDVIIRGVKGEYYPCKRDIFEETYDPA